MWYVPFFYFSVFVCASVTIVSIPPRRETNHSMPRETNHSMPRYYMGHCCISFIITKVCIVSVSLFPE